MKYSIVTLSALAAVATAQSIGACDGKAQACIEDAVAESGLCDAGDWHCACNNISAIQGGATGCVLKACDGAAGALEVITEVEAVCKEVLANPPATEEPAPEPTDDTEEPAPEPTDDTEEPAPEPTDDTEEPAPEPTDDTEEPTETDAGEEPTETADGGDDDDDDAYPEEPETSGTEEPEPTETFVDANGAGSLVPAGALVAGLLALAI